MTIERGRIEFLLRRDGRASTIDWVRRTLQIYRGALLARDGYAREFRSTLIQSCVDFRRWLRSQDTYG